MLFSVLRSGFGENVDTILTFSNIFVHFIYFIYEYSQLSL